MAAQLYLLTARQAHMQALRGEVRAQMDDARDVLAMPPRTEAKQISKVLSVVVLYSTYTRALTFESSWPERRTSALTGYKFSKVSSILALHGNYTRVLTF